MRSSGPVRMLCIVGLMIVSTGANAVDGLTSKAADLCYVRRYDSRHLADHPNQNVVAIAVSRSVQDAKGKDGALLVQARLKDAPGTVVSSSAMCTPDPSGRLRCEPQGCEPGAFFVETTSDGSLVIRSPERNLLLGCLEGRPGALIAKSDDRVFFLTAAPTSACSGF